ncbi:MAG: hypothetical protein KDA52_05745 [Planctomycetaceae bacterium]|nr:hypothetical protein [Planctomycetaceae bacterium]
MEVDEKRDGPRLVTPTRIVVLLTLITLGLVGALLVAHLSRPSTFTLNISAPVGKTVVCHVVVDGKAAEYEDEVPVTYRLVGHDIAYAMICTDPAAGDLDVLAFDQSGTGGSWTGAGVKGTYMGRWWGSSARGEIMTPTHVTTMRKAVMAQHEETEGNEENESP